MKSLQKFKHAIVAVVALSIAGCTSEILSEIEAEVIENPDYEIIRSLGLSTEDIIETEDSYIVEGDIVFDKNSMQNYVGKTRQLYSSLISPSNVIDIKVWINPELKTNNGGGATWYQATVDALAEWSSRSSIPNCTIKYRIVALEKDADVVVRRNSAISGSTIARAAYPSNGNPGSYVEVGFDYDRYSAAHKKYMMVHEFGHNLGFGHMDESGNQIIGTPTSDPQSVMASTWVGGRSWNTNGYTSNYDGFTPGDISAAQITYGSLWNVEVTGPATTTPLTQVYYSIPTTLPSDMVFDRWTVSPNDISIVGGWTDRTLNIKFNSLEQYTVVAHFTILGSMPFVFTKTVNVTPPPPPTPNIVFERTYNSHPDPNMVYPEESIRVYVTNSTGSETYQWHTNGSIISNYSSRIEVYIPYYPQIYMLEVSCTATKNGISRGSNTISLGVDWNSRPYRAPQKPKDDLKIQEAQ